MASSGAFPRGRGGGVESRSRGGSSGVGAVDRQHHPSRKNPSEDNIEKEYIYNLQQQIYFYELELQFLREKAKSRGPPLKSRGTETRDELELVEAAPLEDALYSLKKKYVEQEQLHKKTVEELIARAEAAEQELGNVESIAEQRRVDNQSLLERLVDTEAIQSDCQRKYAKEIVELQKQVEERDERITTMQAHLDRMQAEKEEVQEARAFADEQLASLKVELADSNAALETTARKLGTLQLQHEKLQEQFDRVQQPKTETEESLTAEVRKLQNEKRSTDIKIRQLELQLEQANEAKKMAEEESMRCVEETHNLRTKLADASKELDAVRAEHQSLRAQWEDSEESRLNHNEHVRQEEEIRRGLQAQIDTTNNKLVEMDRRRNDLQKKFDALEEEKLRLEEALAHREDRYQSMDAVDQELRIENRMLSDTLADTKQELAQVKVSLAESRNTSSELKVRVRQLQKRIDVAHAVEMLKVEEFQNLMSSNIQVAQNIQALMSKLRGEKDREEDEDEEEEEEEEEEEDRGDEHRSKSKGGGEE